MEEGVKSLGVSARASDTADTPTLAEAPKRQRCQRLSAWRSIRDGGW